LSNSLYDKGREAFLCGGINWLADNIKAVLVDASDYTPNLATHQYLSDIPSGARVATSGAMSGKTATAGVADADDIVFAAVTGDPSEYMVLYKDTGTDTTSPLIAFIDTATGLPVTPNGTNITVQFDAGVNRIFKL
jgi:phage tail sheath gpL-like